MRWYVGGQLVSTVATTYPTNATTMNLVLGRGDEAGAVTLDEVAFYGQALPAARVAAHFGAAR